MESVLNLLGSCFCLKPHLEVEGVTYKLLRHLTEGGFSSIDLVENTRTGKVFVVKRITCHSIEDQNVARNEIEMNKKFTNHPNIISVIGATLTGTADIVHNITSEVVIVFPFYKAGSLHDELERRRLAESPLAETTLLNIFHSVCLAVQELHQSEPPIAHRDIKPHNVLLDSNFKPVLMDFGSCAPARVSVTNLREAQYLQDTAAERCSMCYRPPELFQVSSSCQIDERTDIWSLGCLLYAMMFYSSPYDVIYERGDSVALAVQSGKISFPPATNFSPDLLQLVTEMTNVDIDFRINIDSVIEKVEAMMNTKC